MVCGCLYIRTGFLILEPVCIDSKEDKKMDFFVCLGIFFDA